MEMTREELLNNLAAILINGAKDEGCMKIANGVELRSKESMLAEQADWAEEDEAKEFNFTTAPYWLTTDSGAGPIPVHGANDSDLIEAIENA